MSIPGHKGTDSPRYLSLIMLFQTEFYTFCPRI
ncbi:uncharacterized protein FFM5_15326 [Fusarium fujikuroi]|nr:uncharacterized protein FFM5_15326 [Fusarium fujikuroi]